MFMPCDSNYYWVSTYQQWISPCSVSCFDDISANLEYLGSSHASMINGALYVIELYHGIDALFVFMQPIIETKGLSKSFSKLFSLLRLYPQVSTPLSVLNSHNWVCGSWNCKWAYCLSWAQMTPYPRGGWP